MIHRKKTGEVFEREKPLYMVELPRPESGSIITDSGEEEHYSLEEWRESFGREEEIVYDIGDSELLADGENRLRMVSGGGIDRTGDGYLVLIRKDEYSPRDPLNFTASNGYSESLEEVKFPQKVINRELNEETVYFQESETSGKFLRPKNRKISESLSLDILGKKYKTEFRTGLNNLVDGPDQVSVWSEGFGGEYSTTETNFCMNPERASINLLSIRELPFSSEDILNGDVNIYDGEGDPEGWNRGIYLIDEEKLLDSIDEASEPGTEIDLMDAYVSEFKNGRRSFRKQAVRIDSESLKDKNFTVEEIENVEIPYFTTSRALRQLLRKKK